MSLLVALLQIVKERLSGSGATWFLPRFLHGLAPRITSNPCKPHSFADTDTRDGGNPYWKV